MESYHVVAMAKNRVIGKDNRLPWHFPEDLKAFRALTMGQTLLMGRKTFESIGRPLPGRPNFVLSRNSPRETPPGVRFFGSVDEAAAAVMTERLFIIGGAEVYRATLGLVDGVYLTYIDADYEGDAFYPELPAAFCEEARETVREQDPKIECVLYRRRRDQGES